MTTPRKIAEMVAELRLTASTLQQVMDACLIAGPGAEILQHYPKMLDRQATAWETAAAEVPWPEPTPFEPFTSEELAAMAEADSLLRRLRSGDSNSP